MKRLRVVLASSEVTPFAKTGGLADVAGVLPFALKSHGCDVKVFLPLYGQTKKQARDLAIGPLRAEFITRLGSGDAPFSVYSGNRGGVDFYLIEKDQYYDRDFLYGTPKGDYADNALRFAFFSRAVLEVCMAVDFRCDIFHCNDWQTGLLPFYARHDGCYVDFFKNTKILFTIHNLAYQGLFLKEAMPQVGIGYEFFRPEALEFYGKFSFMKSGILYSDAINTVSKGYAREILTPEYGCGLEGLLEVRRDDLHGVLNGADYSNWNPETDRFIKANYSTKNLKGKLKCKKDLLASVKLKAPLKAPLLGVITRLAQQKGIDIVVDGIEEIVKLKCGIVILGIGDEKYHRLLARLSRKYPKNIAVKIAFDNSLAHKIEAGCDMFLMPSRYEPCGLNQMYSLRYGTIPVVRATGGLDDTIIDYTKDRNSGNGFKFENADPLGLTEALRRAVSVYANKREWEALMLKAMKCDFSWRHSAAQYIQLYNAYLNPSR